MLKRIMIQTPKFPPIFFADIDEEKPIFAKKDGRLVGMVSMNDRGYLCIMTGLKTGFCAKSRNLEEFLFICEKQGYEFYQED